MKKAQDNDGEILSMYIESGVPYEPLKDDDTWEDVLSRLFKVSKRQIRDWQKAKAIKCWWLNEHKNIVVAQRGKKQSNIGLIFKTKTITPKK
jgi:hypothetical protein